MNVRITTISQLVNLIYRPLNPNDNQYKNPKSILPANAKANSAAKAIAVFDVFFFGSTVFISKFPSKFTKTQVTLIPSVSR